MRTIIIFHELFSNSKFLLAVQQKYCETSSKRDVTLRLKSLKNVLQRRGNRSEKQNLILLRAMLLATKMLRDCMIARHVTPCNFAYNLCRNKIARQIARQNL